MGMVSGRGYQEVGVASGWKLWVWLECIGVVSGCCCKEVYRYPHNWGEPERAHTYRTAVQNPPYIYIYTCPSSICLSGRYPIWSREGPL